LAFAFGAIVSPPDAISVTTILKRFSISSRLQTLLEGESLINDASALILYKLSLTALFAGTFSWFEGTTEFVKMVGGGIIVGLVLGFLLQSISKSYLEPVLGVVFSFTIPYITYIIAHFLGTSGVLAVVVNGLIGSRMILTHNSSLRRVLGYAAWDIFIILLNCFVFILIGLQLRKIADVLTIDQMFLYTLYGVLITVAMILIRMVWVYAKNCIHYLRNGIDFSSFQCMKAIREAAIVSWSGMRGIVSLIAALALPFTYSDGSPLEGRDEIIFITFIVILLTLLIPGTTLPALLRWLKMQRHSEQADTQEIRKKLAKIADQKLHSMLANASINEAEHHFLKEYFKTQMRIQEMTHLAEHKMHGIEAARLTVIQAQRKHLLELWKKNELEDKLLNHLENELDLVEIHIARAELK
jgi:CPA1 family monovalent cation:H+ antiporter